MLGKIDYLAVKVFLQSFMGKVDYISVADKAK